MLVRNRRYAYRVTAFTLLATAAAGCRDQLPTPTLTPDAGPARSGAAGSLQYFGYVGNGDDEWSLTVTKGFTNFAHVATRNSTTDPWVRDRVTAIAARGLKATIDLGRVFWCDEAANFRFRCPDWESRWAQWKSFNAGIMTPDRVIAVTVLDEPFKKGVNMGQYEQVVARVKADYPWVKTWMFEAACTVRQECGYDPLAFGRYQGTLPGVDWITVGDYAIWPLTDTRYLAARDQMKSRFPGKGWLYVMDGYWDPHGHGRQLFNPNYDRWGIMKIVARQWYDLARADPAAVLLGVFIWGPNSSGWTESMEFQCTTLLEHVAIGREITGKVRTNAAQPFGRVERIEPDAYGSSATLVGWASDPDGTVCEHPRIDLYANGQYFATAYYPNYPAYDRYFLDWFWTSPGNAVAYRFQRYIPPDLQGQRITAVARDLDAGSVTLPSDCAENPACVWYPQNHEPWGYMDGITSTGLAWGWACDRDGPQASTRVRLALDDGTPIGTYTTNLNNEQEVADECGGGYTHRFQAQLPSWTRGRTVVAFAQDLVAGEVQIPWIWPCDWACTWW